MTELEQAQQQLREVQATVGRLVEEAKKPKEFEFKYERYTTCMLHDTEISECMDGTNKTALKHGRYRKTKEAADDALALNMRVGRLHALAEQLGGLKKWRVGEKNWFVEHFYDRYVAEYTCRNYHPERVYMTEECAKKISEMLNDGTFKLEV